MKAFQCCQHIQQEWPHETFWYLSRFCNIVFYATTTQFNLNIEQIILFPCLVKLYAMFITAKLMISSNFFQPFSPVIFASIELFRFLHCIQFPILSTANLKDLTKAAFSKFWELFEALIKIRIGFGSIVAGSIESFIPIRCYCLRWTRFIIERNNMDFVVYLSITVLLRGEFWRFLDLFIGLIKLKMNKKYLFIIMRHKWSS